MFKITNIKVKKAYTHAFDNTSTLALNNMIEKLKQTTHSQIMKFSKTM